MLEIVIAISLCAVFATMAGLIVKLTKPVVRMVTGADLYYAMKVLEQRRKKVSSSSDATSNNPKPEK